MRLLQSCHAIRPVLDTGFLARDGDGHQWIRAARKSIPDVKPSLEVRAASKEGLQDCLFKLALLYNLTEVDRIWGI